MRRSPGAWLLAVLAASVLVAAGCASTRRGDHGGAPAGGEPAGGPAAPERGRGAARELSGSDVRLDLSLAEDILALWRQNDRTSRAARIVDSPSLRVFQAFLRGQSGCRATSAQIERALAHPDSGVCGFGLQPAHARRTESEELVRLIRDRGPELRARIAERVAPYLPGADSWRPVRIRLGFASQLTFDAVTLDGALVGDSLPVILVNMTDVLLYGGTAAERALVLESVLAHETFHAALRQVRHASPRWRDYAGRGPAPLAHVAEILLNEGVGHYIDWRGRAGSDTLFTDRPGKRETYAFSQLALACRRLRERSGSAWDRTEILQMASTGPLWNKYGAISGMFAAHRIERAMGRAALVGAVAGGPLEFLRLYRDCAARDSTLKTLPPELTSFL